MDLSKTLILYSSTPYFIHYMNEYGVKVDNAYRQVGVLGRIIRKFCFIMKIMPSYFLGSWKARLDHYENIIYFEDSSSLVPLKYIHKKRKKETRVILWYWNTVSSCTDHPKKIPDCLCEKWSFDREDCRKYNMKYNTTFYFKDIILPYSGYKGFVYFLGLNKGRVKSLNKIKDALTIRNIDCKFYVIDETVAAKQRLPYLTYQENLENIVGASTLLDIVKEGQSGHTLRVMESLFFRKKLITNCKTVKQELFYHKNNCFILGEDPIESLNDFLNMPYHDINLDEIEYYDFGNWLNRFDL